MKTPATGLMIAILFATVVDAETRPCVKSFNDCKPNGCAEDGTPEAAANRQQRTNLPKRAPPPPTPMRIVDFEELQASIDHLQPRGLAVPDRRLLRNRKMLRLNEGGAFQIKAVEGDYVVFTGFIVGTPRVARPDSGNCHFLGRESNHWRINLGEVQGDTEFDSILAIMTPWVRPLEWTLAKLRGIASNRRKVRVSGLLFYDSKRLVNAEADREIMGEPRRLSVWEIRPILAFDVCRENNPIDCDSSDDWDSLSSAPTEPLR